MAKHLSHLTDGLLLVGWVMQIVLPDWCCHGEVSESTGTVVFVIEKIYVFVLSEICLLGRSDLIHRKTKVDILPCTRFNPIATMVNSDYASKTLFGSLVCLNLIL